MIIDPVVGSFEEDLKGIQVYKDISYRGSVYLGMININREIK